MAAQPRNSHRGPGAAGAGAGLDLAPERAFFVVPDPNVVYQFYFFERDEYTHQHAPWREDRDIGIHYPDPRFEIVYREAVNDRGRVFPFDKNYLKFYLQRQLEFGQEWREAFKVIFAAKVKKDQGGVSRQPSFADPYLESLSRWLKEASRPEDRGGYEVDERLRQGAIVLGALAGGGLVVLVLMERQRETAERLIRRVLRVLPARVGDALWSIAEGLLHGLGGLADVRIVALVLVYSVVLWGLITLTYTLSFLALDVPIPLLAGSLVTVVIVAASVFLPQGPGFIGTWQAGCVFALYTVFGVPHDIAVSYSLLTWVIQMVVNVGSASVGLALEGVSLRDLMSEGRREVPEA